MSIDYEPGTDAAVLAEGYASVTALSVVCEQPDADLSGLGLPRSGGG
jgi:5'-nucleotidase